MGVDCRHLPWSLHHCGVFLGPEMPSGFRGGALGAIPQGRVEQGSWIPPPSSRKRGLHPEEGS